MRIMHVTDCYLPGLGGIELHVRDLATQQRAHGTDVVVVTPLTATGSSDDPDWVTRVPIEGPATRPGPQGGRGLAEVIERFQPHVVHCHLSVLSPFTATMVRLAAGSSLPTVVTVHSMWNNWALSSVLCSFYKLRYLPVLWTAVSAAAAVQVEHGLGRGFTVSVLPNAVDLSAWAPVDGGDCRGTAPVRIVTVMRLARRKRPLPFASMLRRVRAGVPAEIDLRATIIGDGPKRDDLRRYLGRHRMDSWVDTPGQLERSEIRREFARSSFYVAPARLESFGIAALEARTSGLPIVASSRSGVGEFVTDGRDGLLVDGDEAMTRAMIELVTNDECRRALTNAARGSAPDFGWEAGVYRSLDAYARAAALVDGVRIAGPVRSRPASLVIAGVGQ